MRCDELFMLLSRTSINQLSRRTFELIREHLANCRECSLMMQSLPISSLKIEDATPGEPEDIEGEILRNLPDFLGMVQ